MNIAIYSVIFLVALVLLSHIGQWVRRKNGDGQLSQELQTSQQPSPILSSPPGEDEGGQPSLSDDDDECCGEHEVCEKGKINRALRTDIEYFDDEELDVYRGTPSDEYTDEAVEEFREVLYTMDPKEIDDWLKSLELRGVALPDVLKDELFMLLDK